MSVDPAAFFAQGAMVPQQPVNPPKQITYPAVGYDVIQIGPNQVALVLTAPGDPGEVLLFPMTLAAASDISRKLAAASVGALDSGNGGSPAIEEPNEPAPLDANDVPEPDGQAEG